MYAYISNVIRTYQTHVHTYIHTHMHIYTHRSLAEKLNQWENHRTDIKYENALIFKVFLFEFVNNFLAMIWIAFLSPYLCTHMDTLTETLARTNGDKSCLAQKFEVSGASRLCLHVFCCYVYLWAVQRNMSF